MFPIFSGLVHKDVVAAANQESKAKAEKLVAVTDEGKIVADGALEQADYSEQKTDMKTINAYSVVGAWHVASPFLRCHSYI